MQSEGGASEANQSRKIPRRRDTNKKIKLVRHRGRARLDTIEKKKIFYFFYFTVHIYLEMMWALSIFRTLAYEKV